MTTKFSLLKEGDGTAFSPRYASVIVKGLSQIEPGGSGSRVTPPEASSQIIGDYVEKLIKQLREVQKDAQNFLSPN